MRWVRHNHAIPIVPARSPSTRRQIANGIRLVAYDARQVNWTVTPTSRSCLASNPRHKGSDSPVDGAAASGLLGLAQICRAWAPWQQLMPRTASRSEHHVPSASSAQHHSQQAAGNSNPTSPSTRRFRLTPSCWPSRRPAGWPSGGCCSTGGAATAGASTRLSPGPRRSVSPSW